MKNEWTEDVPAIEGFNRIKIRFLSLDGLSRDDVLVSNDGVIPQIVERSFYLARKQAATHEDIQAWLTAWNIGNNIRQYKYSSKDEVSNCYIYVEIPKDEC